MPVFEKYFPVKEGGSYSVKDIFSPEIAFTEEEFSLRAQTGRKSHVIYGIRDVVKATGKVNGARSNFQGMIGERILSVVLDELVDSIIEEETRVNPGSQAVGKVLREEASYEGKGFAVTYNNKYLLRYHGQTNFFILQKTHLEDPDSWYQQERLGLKASEIDGLAYLHVGAEKYLFVGEAKTITSWKNIGDSRFFEHVTDELFPSLLSLFPRHTLSFVFLGRGDILFEGNRLKPYPQRLTEVLESRDVRTIFVPFPATPRSLDEYAESMSKMLPLAREILSNLAKR